MKWTFSFWTLGHAPLSREPAFGCASHGMAAANTWLDPEATDVIAWPTRLAGDVLTGSYADLLMRLRDRQSKPAAVIALFGHASGIRIFLDECHYVLGATPIVGAGAARSNGKTSGELLPAASDVSLLLITEGIWRAETLNVHEANATALTFRASGPRKIAHLRENNSDDWQPAAVAFHALQGAHGRADSDCESITLSDDRGRNIHVSLAGECIHTGADLPADGLLILRTVSRSEAARRLTELCSVPGALVFGCAGLRELTDVPIAVAAGTLVGFMFGELVTLDGRPQFGNLMAVRLVPSEGNPRRVMPHSTHY